MKRKNNVGLLSLAALLLGGLVFFLFNGPIFSGEPREANKKIVKHCWETIQEALTNNDSKVREQAVQGMDFVDNKFVRNSLTSSLQDESDYVKIWAAKILAQKGDMSGKNALIKILRDEGSAKAPQGGSLAALVKLQSLARGHVRGEAAKVLGLMNDEGVLLVLREAKRDPDGRVRDGAAVAMALMGDKTEAFVFASALTDQDKGIRLAAAEALESIHDPNTAQPLRGILQDPDENVRSTAVRALGAMKDLGSLESFTQLLNDQSGLVRESAAWALGELGEPKRVPHLKAALSDENFFVKLAATVSLGKMGDATGLPVIEAGINTNDNDARTKSALALGYLFDQSSQGLAIKTLQDGNLSVRLGAATSILRMEKRLHKKSEGE